MKVDFTNNKIIIYLYQDNLEINNISVLNLKIKKIIISLIKKYNFNFDGYFKVSIYHNIKCGSIIEIEKMYETSFNLNTINLKIIVYKNVPMYFEFDNFYFDQIPKKMIVKNNKYYISVNDIDNIFKYIEYGKMIYFNN